MKYIHIGRKNLLRPSFSPKSHSRWVPLAIHFAELTLSQPETAVIYLCQHSQLEKGVMASPLHVQRGGGSRSTCLFVVCAEFLHSFPCLLICSRDMLRPQRRAFGAPHSPPRARSSCWNAGQSMKGEERSQRMGYYSSTFSRWVGNK